MHKQFTVARPAQQGDAGGLVEWEQRELKPSGE